MNELIFKYIKNVYKIEPNTNIPFTKEEIEELKNKNEILVYLPKGISVSELLSLMNIKTNFNVHYELNIKNVMVNEDQWFITSAANYPEMLNKNALDALKLYNSKNLKGMDLRRYLAFVLTFYYYFNYYPDKEYWTFLLGGSYDRSGVSIIGFDRNGVLSHHGWMKNFKSKFCGHRYVILPPRKEINDETKQLKRDYR